jgi:hypothetical protein
MEGSRRLSILDGFLSPTFGTLLLALRTRDTIGKAFLDMRYTINANTNWSRNCDKITTARCYDERGHMSWCVYWVEERGLPCGNRCRNTHEYCEKHTKLRPADYLQDQDETAQEEQGVAEQLGDNNGGQEQHEEQGITEPLEDSNGGHEQQEEQGVAGQLEDADGGHEQEGQDLWEQEDGEQGQGSWIQYQEPTKPYTEKHIPQPRLRKKEVRLQKEAERAVTFAQKIKDVFGKKGRKMMKQRTGY